MLKTKLSFLLVTIFVLLASGLVAAESEYANVLIQFKTNPFPGEQLGTKINAFEAQWYDESLAEKFSDLGLQTMRQVFLGAKERVFLDGSEIILPNFKHYYECEVRNDDKLSDNLLDLQRHESISLVEGLNLSEQRLIIAEPPDHYWEHADSDSSLWWLHGVAGDPAVYSLDAARAWSFRPSDAEVCVAILDEGVWMDHPDLTARGDSECCGTVPDTCNFHGTTMCGFIAANHGYYNAAGDSIFDAGGMVGVMDGPDVVSYNVKCEQSVLGHAEDQIMHAVDENDADVLMTASYPDIYNIPHLPNSSRYVQFDPYYDNYSVTIRRAWQYAYQQGKTCISAGGNHDQDQLYYPANYGHSLIGVGAAKRHGELYTILNTGTNLDFLAPSDAMLGTVVTSSYDTYYEINLGGTSAASALLSGSVGVLNSIRSTHMPAMTLVADDYYGLLIAGAEDVTNYPATVGWDPESGWGRINLGKSAALMVEDYQVTTGIASGGVVVDSSSVLNNVRLYDFDFLGLTSGEIYPVKWFRVETWADWSTETAYLDSTSCWGRFVGTNGYSAPEDSSIHDIATKGYPGGNLLMNVNHCEPIRSDLDINHNRCRFVTYGYRVYHQNYPDSTRVLATLGPVVGAEAQVGYGVTGKIRTRLSGVLTSNQTLSGQYWIDGDVVISSGVTVTVAPGTEFQIASTDKSNLGVDSSRVEFIVDGSLDLQGAGVGSIVFTSGAVQPEAADWYGIISSSSANSLTLDGFSISGAEYGVCSYGGQINVSSGNILNCLVGLHLENVSGVVENVEVQNCTDSGVILRGSNGGAAAVALENVDSHDNMYGFIFGPGTNASTISGGSSANNNALSGVYCLSKMDLGPGLSIVGNGQNGLQMSRLGLGAAGLVDSLQISGHSSGSGVRLDSLSSPEIRNCVITNNFSNVQIKTMSNPILGDVALGKGMNNWFENPTKYNIVNRVSGTSIKAENCYWGPLVGGAPICKILGQVDFIPWLDQEPQIIQGPFMSEEVVQTAISSAYPNPFNPSVQIKYSVVGGGQDVLIRIFDISGRYVATLVDGHVASGVHVAEWMGCDDHGKSVSAGVYMYRIRSGGENEVGGKLTLLK